MKTNPSKRKKRFILGAFSLICHNSYFQGRIMNILYICNEYPPCKSIGGIGIFTQTIAEHLVKKGHNIIVAGIYEDDEIRETEQLNGVIVYRFKSLNGFFCHFRSLWPFFTLLRHIIKMHNIELIESPDYQGILSFYYFGKIKHLVRIHGTNTYFSEEMKVRKSPKWFVHEWLQLKRAFHIISVSQYAWKRTSHIFHLNNGAEIIFNPYKGKFDSSVLNNKREPFKVVFSGTLFKKKGIFELIYAWKTIFGRYPLAKLVIMGKDTVEFDGKSVRNKLLDYISQEGLQSIQFLGAVQHSQVLEQLSTSSVAVFPSFSETFGLAPVEAMAQGCPVIFTKRSSGPELVTDGLNGILVNPENPDEIAAAIIRILDNPLFARQLAQNAFTHVENNFSIDLIGGKNVDFYKRVING